MNHLGPMTFSEFLSAVEPGLNQYRNQAIPIEGKAGKSGMLKSQQQFALIKEAALCVRFDLNPPDTGRITHSAKVISGIVSVPYNPYPFHCIWWKNCLGY